MRAHIQALDNVTENFRSGNHTHDGILSQVFMQLLLKEVFDTALKTYVFSYKILSNT